MGKASSAKKVARAAKAGGKVRAPRQTSLLFPIAMAVVVVIGALLVLGAKAEQGGASEVKPRANKDHWHTAYGIYVCDHFLAPFQNQSDTVGIHTHGDGVIHVHPFVSAAAGKNAQLGKFFDQVGATLSDTEMKLSEGLGNFKNGDDCGGKKGHLEVDVWTDATSNTDPVVVTKNLRGVRFTQDRMAMTIAFVADGVKPPKPTSIPVLDQLSDTGTTPTPTDSTTVAGGTTTAPPIGPAAPTTVGPGVSPSDSSSASSTASSNATPSSS